MSFKKKQGQGALEFILIFVFMFVIVSLVISILGGLTTEMRLELYDKERNNFADKIFNEVKLLESSRDGYTRKLCLSKVESDRFYVDVQEDYLILRDRANPVSDRKYYYYTIPGNRTLEVINVSETCEPADEPYLAIIVEKKQSGDHRGLQLE